MKIVDKTVAGVVKFQTLKVGDCFKYGTGLFVKIDNDTDNALGLFSCRTDFLKSETLVTPVKAHIVIGGDDE